MYNDNLMRVDLEPTVSLDVNSSVSGDVDASVSGSLKVDGGELTIKPEGGSLTTEPRFFLLPIKKPYLINKNHVECVVGEWNKDKTKCGIRIFLVSGNSVYLEGAPALRVLNDFGGSPAFDKLTEYVRSYNEKGDKQ